MKQEKKKIELSSQEIEYISGLMETQRSKISLLDKKYKKQGVIREELKTAERIEKKLAFE
jgi:5-bromo-4-chloroindolyl phosphate hydrolysis protein